MRRRHTTTKVTSNRQALRLALAVAFATVPAVATAQLPLPAYPSAQPIANNPSDDLPVYPFSTVDSSRTPSKLVGMLGLGNAAKPQPQPLQSGADNGLPQLPALPKQAIAVVELKPASGPSLSESNAEPTRMTAVLGMPTPAVPQSKPGQEVVMAAATEAVYDTLSDSSETENGSSLSGSLIDIEFDADFASGYTASTAGADTGFHLDDSSSLSVSAGKSANADPELSNSRQPELLKASTGQSLRIQDDSHSSRVTVPQAAEVSRDRVESTASDDMSTSFSLNDLNTNSSSDPVKETVVSADLTEIVIHETITPPAEPILQAASSRRTAQPKPMQIQVEGEPATPARAVREPLLPILARHSQMQQPADIQSVASRSSLTAPSSREELVTSSNSMTVALRDSVNIQTEASIADLSVEDSTICQVIKTSSRSFAVLGLKSGTTRIAVITKDGDEPQVDIQDVIVGSQSNSTDDLQGLAKSLSRSIKQLYPYSSVQVLAHSGQLIAQGQASSEDEARKVLALIRKTSLTPVVDQIRTH